MTELKFDILGILYVSFLRTEDTIAIYKRVSPIDPTPAKYALHELESKGYIEPVPFSDKVKLTDKGAIAYELEEEERKDHSDQQRQQRFQNKISVASVLIPAVSFICGLIVESYFQVVGLLIALFR